VEQLTAAERLIQMVFRDFAAQSISVDSENLGGAALVSPRVFQDSPDEFLLELGQGLLEQNPALDHHSDQRFQLLFQSVHAPQ
jgi:hypothetical protein